MSSPEKQSKASLSEKGMRVGRDFNAIGALAIGGVALAIPGPNVILGGWAAFNAAQAGGFEWARRYVRRGIRKS